MHSWLDRPVLVAACSLVFGCGSAPEKEVQRISVVAGSEYRGAEVTIDGAARGALVDYSLWERVLVEIFAQKDEPNIQLVRLEIPAATFSNGLHRAEMTKQGLASHSFEFVYPFRYYAGSNLECSAILNRNRRFIVTQECSVEPGEPFKSFLNVYNRSIESVVEAEFVLDGDPPVVVKMGTISPRAEEGSHLPGGYRQSTLRFRGTVKGRPIEADCGPVNEDLLFITRLVIDKGVNVTCSTTGRR